MNMRHFKGILRILCLVLFSAYVAGCDGKADPLSTGDYLGDPVLGDGTGTRTDGSDAGQIYTVTKIVEATSDIVGWTNSDLPFTGPRQQLGTNTLNTQWPFEFNYTYPANNYALGDARLLFVTSRDSSDTEGIFVDGVFTGKPPSGSVSTVSTKITHRNYVCTNTCSATDPTPGEAVNLFFMNWILTHYKVGSENTVDLDIASLISSTALSIKNLLDDGVFRVVTGDDAFVQTDTATASRPLLVMEGSTVSKVPLTCSTSPTYKMKNNYLYNDNVGTPPPSASAFSGTVLKPVTSWSTPYTTMRSVEFFYDPRLPKLASYDLLNITKADLIFQLKRTNTGPAAIVINGIGVDQASFDRTLATSEVESWSSDPATLAIWNTFVNSIPATDTSQPATLNLISLLGAAKVKELLLQGKLFVAVAGPVASIYGAANTSTRTYGVAVAGPELVIEGNYAAVICEVPNDPTSPLNGGASGPVDCLTDTAAPIASSINVVNITANSARIQWLTNENSSSRVGYGLISPSTLTTENMTPLLFHTVDITGLSPYKYYQFNVRSTDSCNNQGISTTRSFRTLR